MARACKWGYCLYSGPRSVHRPPWVRERTTPLGTSCFFLCSTHFGVVSGKTNPKSPYSALVVHASGATACIVVLAACIVLRGCAKGLLRWGLHLIPLLFPLWGRFRKNKSKKPVFRVGSLCFFVVALYKNLQCPLPLRFQIKGYPLHFPAVTIGLGIEPPFLWVPTRSPETGNIEIS